MGKSIQSLLAYASVAELIKELADNFNEYDFENTDKSITVESKNPLIKHFIDLLIPYLTNKISEGLEAQPFSPRFINVNDLWHGNNKSAPAELTQFYELLRDYFTNSSFSAQLIDNKKLMHPDILEIFQEFLVVEMFHNMKGNDFLKMLDRVDQMSNELKSLLDTQHLSKILQDNITILLTGFFSKLHGFVKEGGLTYFIKIFNQTKPLHKVDYDLRLKYIREKIFRVCLTQLLLLIKNLQDLVDVLNILENNEAQQLFDAIPAEQYIDWLQTVDPLIWVSEKLSMLDERLMQLCNAIPKTHYASLFSSIEQFIKYFSVLNALLQQWWLKALIQNDGAFCDKLCSTIEQSSLILEVIKNRSDKIYFISTISAAHLVLLASTRQKFIKILAVLTHQEAFATRNELLTLIPQETYTAFIQTIDDLTTVCHVQSGSALRQQVLSVISKEHYNRLLPQTITAFLNETEENKKMILLFILSPQWCIMTTSLHEYYKFCDYLVQARQGYLETDYKLFMQPILKKYSAISACYTSSNNSWSKAFTKGDVDSQAIWDLAKCEDNVNSIITAIQLKYKKSSSSSATEKTDHLIGWSAAQLTLSFNAVKYDEVTPLVELDENNLSAQAKNLVRSLGL